MKIERVTLRQIRMPLVHFFETSFGRTYARHIVLVEAHADGISGWGEATAGENPFYNEEWTESAWRILRDYAVPRVLGRELDGPEAVYPLTAHIRGHNMAKGALESAAWDLAARMEGAPLWKKIGGGARREIPCGVSIGIQDSVEELFEIIERELAAGYQRIKMKIKPGWDVDVVRARARALSAHQTDGRCQLRLHAGRRRSSAQAGRLLPDDDRAAARPRRHHRPRRIAGAPRRRPSAWTNPSAARTTPPRPSGCAPAGILNIKLGRVGGFAEARRLHDVAQAAGIPVWCGGMLEAGIGRAHNVALATLPNFVLPGDVSASRRYWQRDIIEPAVETTAHGTIEIRDQPGFGYALDREFIAAITVREETAG